MSKQIFARAAVLTLVTSISYNALSESHQSVHGMFDIDKTHSSNRFSRLDRIIKECTNNLRPGTTLSRFAGDAGDRSEQKFCQLRRDRQIANQRKTKRLATR